MTALPLIALIATSLAIVVAITGGFRIDLGPLRISSHNPFPAAIAAALMGTVAWWWRRAGAQALLGRALPALDRHAAAIAVVIAAAAAGTGIGYGTYSAAASDSSGYVSQAQLLAAGQLVRDEPLILDAHWRDAEWPFSPLGYRPAASAGATAPSYPPGLPLTMAPAVAAFGELGAYLVVPLLGFVAVLCTYALGARLHSRLGGVVAAALLATSPIFLFQIVQPMSDVPAAAWWTLALLLALLDRPAPTATAVGAGIAVSLAVLTRPNLAPLGLPVALALVDWRLRSISLRACAQRLLPYGASSAAGVAALLCIQWRRYGHPLASGYGNADDYYSLANIGPNVAGYAHRLLVGETASLTLAAALVVMALTWRRRSALSLRAAAVPAAWFAAVLLLSYLPYGVFPDWQSLRFLLPAFPTLFVLLGALLTEAVRRLPVSAQGAAVVLSLVTACSVNVARARAHDAFNMQIYEERYRSAGRYLEAALPPNAVIVAVIQGGSARHYTGRPALRWDVLTPELDDAVDRLRALGRYPVFLVDFWEPDEIRKRFPRSVYGRLDWPARARFGHVGDVRLFDPTDREPGARRPPFDRVR